MSKSFMDIMQEAKSAEDIKRTPSLPTGDYDAIIIKADFEAPVPIYAQEEYGDDAKCLRVFYRPTEPLDDTVDEEDLEACEGWKNKMLSQDFVREEDGIKLIDINNDSGLVIHAGLKAEDYFGEDGLDKDELAQDLKNQHVRIRVGHRPNKNAPDFPYEVVKGTASLD